MTPFQRIQQLERQVALMRVRLDEHEQILAALTPEGRVYRAREAEWEAHGGRELPANGSRPK